MGRFVIKEQQMLLTNAENLEEFKICEDTYTGREYLIYIEDNGSSLGVGITPLLAKGE